MRIALLPKLALLGFVVVLVFDGINLGRQLFSADGQAGEAARAATQAYAQSHNIQLAYNSAVAVLEGTTDTIETETFVFDEVGNVTLKLHRKADTMMIGRLHESWTEITIKGTAARPS